MERKITIEESVPYTEDYQNKMLEENQVEGLLEMHGRGMDDKSCYDYDVSGKVSMKALYEKHTMSGEEIKILLKSILRVVKEVERYLLNVELYSDGSGVYFLHRRKVLFLLLSTERKKSVGRISPSERISGENVQIIRIKNVSRLCSFCIKRL